MREKGKLAKKFAAFCFIFLVMGFISAVCLQAQNQEKETKKKTDIKSEQTKGNPAEQQANTESEGDIKPPEGEQWVAPGDEELYKFDINPVTPKVGITGGFLVYYGHFIKPPYKVETEIWNDENGEYLGVKVVINGLTIIPMPDIIKNRFFKIIKKENNLSKEELECYKEQENASTKIDKELKEVVQKLNTNDAKIIEKAMKRYLGNNPDIEYYKFKSIWSCDIKLNICNDNEITYYFDWGKPIEKTDLNENKRWRKSLSLGVEYISTNMHSTPDNLPMIADILNINTKAENKIKMLYIFFNDIKLAKFIFYNSDVNSYLADRNSK